MAAGKTTQTPAETVDAILAATSAAPEPVVVADYAADWPELFRRIAEPVRHVLAEIADVEHVGSTAVPGLAAKPVIDVDVVVRSEEDVPVAIERLRALGYVYQGDKGIEGRDAFLSPPGAPRHHLYVVVAGSKPQADHVLFRDFLRAHPGVAREYGDVKRRLAAEHPNDRARYAEGKAEFVARVMEAARAGRAAEPGVSQLTTSNARSRFRPKR